MTTVGSGVVAGAAGTVSLNVATYLDMAIRGRASSGAPSQLVEKMTDGLHLPLAPEGTDKNSSLVQNRQSGLGALLGYVNGLGVGLLYGLLRSRSKSIPLPLAAVGVGLAAMAASDVPLIASRVSNPKSWGISGWASDLIPHLIYGLVTVTTYEAIKGND